MVAPATKNLKSTASQENTHTSGESDPILCPHCRRTASNGIKCKGICVADNDY